MHSFLKRKAIRKPDTNKKSKSPLTLLFNRKPEIQLAKEKKCVIKLNLNFHYGNPLAKRPNINIVKHCRDVYMNLKQRPKKNPQKTPLQMKLHLHIYINLKQILKTFA